MKNPNLICADCAHRVRGEYHGDICEQTGKHIYWNQKDCPDYAKNEQERKSE